MARSRAREIKDEYYSTREVVFYLSRIWVPVYGVYRLYGHRHAVWRMRMATTTATVTTTSEYSSHTAANLKRKTPTWYPAFKTRVLLSFELKSCA